VQAESVHGERRTVLSSRFNSRERERVQRPDGRGGRGVRRGVYRNNGVAIAASHRNLEDSAMSKTRSVKDLMSPDIMTVADDMTTDELARYLVEREISGAPVVDSQGHLVGVVSMTDIGRSMAEPSEVESSRSSGFYRDVGADVSLEDLGQRYVEQQAVTVRDVMTPVIHQVPVTASGVEAARLMVDQHIHRLVVTQGKEPVGMITSLDLLKTLAERP
jgi:predicted transcriptional regulator